MVRSSIALVCCALVLAGCDTDKQLRQQELDLLLAEEKALLALESTLKNVQSVEGDGRVSLFLSTGLINGILAGASDLKLTFAGVEGAEVLVKSVQTEFKLGLPLVRVEATASKRGLEPKLDVSAVARLEPTIVSGASPKLKLKVHLDSFVPRAKWGIFDWRIGGFVRDLSRVKLTEELRNLGSIEVPLEADLPLNLPAKKTPISFTGVNADVHTPALSLAGKVVAGQVLTLPDGLHVYGTVSTKGGQ